MIKIFLKLITRNFQKERNLNVLNILGLTFGLIAFALVSLYTDHEYSYDDFHYDPENTYRLEGKTNNEFWFSNIDRKYGKEMKSGIYPAIKRVIQFTTFGNIFLSVGEKRFGKNKIYRVQPGSDFFEIFALEMLEGQREGILDEPYATVLTRTTAKKYFGDKLALGQVINYDTLLLMVKGVIEDLPTNSHLDFEMIYANPRSPEQHFHAFTYLQLVKGANHVNMEQQILEMEQDLDDFHKLTMVKLIKLNAIHFESEAVFGAGGKGDKRQMTAFLITGLLILLISIANYINLSLAVYSGKRLEIGMRKILGESKVHIIYILALESLLVSILCIALAMLGITIILPHFSEFLGLDIENKFFSSPFYWLGGGLFVFSVSMLTITYPAMVLTNTKVSLLIKSKTSINTMGSFRFRNILIFVQFVLLFILSISAWFISRQMTYIDNRDLGFSANGVIKIQNAFFIGGVENYNVLKERLLSYAEIESVTHGAVMGDAMAPLAYTPEGHDIIYENLLSYGVGESYFDLMNIEIIEGDFRKVMEAAESGQVVSLVNQSFINQYHWQNDPIGKTLVLRPGTENELHRTVSAVFKDFHFFSLKEAIVPQIISLRKDPTNVNLNILVKSNPANFHKAFDIIKKEWLAIIPDRPFEYELLDDEIRAIYAEERRVGNLSLIFSILAVLLSLEGLTVFIIYMTKQKSKEIAVRKVLGATTMQIIMMLNKRTFIIIITAAIIGSTASYFLISEWLNNFAYTITLNPLAFVSATILVYAIVFFITGSQSLNSANSNPVEALKQE